MTKTSFKKSGEACIFPQFTGKGDGPGVGVISAFYCPSVLFFAPAGLGKATDWTQGTPSAVKGRAGKGSQGGLFRGHEVGSGF